MVKTEDNPITPIHGLTAENLDYFEIDLAASNVKIKGEDYPIFQFNYSLSMDRIYHTRHVYTALNALSDLGGLYIMLWCFSIAFLGCLSH